MIRRRLTTALLSLLLSIVAFAAQKNLDKDITMVTYEQGWMDTNGALSLKNNTGVEVKNVVFLITYLDMSGNELDYEEFNKSVSIAPGKTKKIDIPAYEQERFYHYYKSPDNEMEPKTAFKIKFQLKDYNVEGEAEELNSSSLIRERNTKDGFYLIIAISILLFLDRHINWFVCHGCRDGTETEPKRSDLDFIEPHRDAFIDDHHPFGYRGKQRL